MRIAEHLPHHLRPTLHRRLSFDGCASGAVKNGALPSCSYGAYQREYERQNHAQQHARSDRNVDAPITSAERHIAGQPAETKRRRDLQQESERSQDQSENQQGASRSHFVGIPIRQRVTLGTRLDTSASFDTSG